MERFDEDGNSTGSQQRSSQQQQQQQQQPLTRLSERDREAVRHATKTAMTHVSVGTWLGAIVGTCFAFRFRWASAYLKSGAATGQARKLPDRLMRGVREHDAAYETAEGAALYRRRLLWTGAGWAMLGSFLGAQIGFGTGNSAARRVIRTEGDEQKITRALEDAVKGVKQQVQDRTNGAASPFPPPPRPGFPDQPRSRQPLPVMSPPNQSQSRSGDGEAMDESFYEAQTVRDYDDSPPPQQRQATSRWDDLRKAQAAPPSKWDTIREASGRETMRNASSTDLDGLSRSQSRRSSDSDDGRQQEQSYDERRRNFEEMMQREARGGDDSFK